MAAPGLPLADALTPRPDASPGLMRRRYSMPETIMRKYRLAQLRSDSEESEPATAPSRAASPASLASPARGSCASLCEPPAHRFLRRDRELMRKSALLRRLWGGRQTASTDELAPPPSCSCDARYCSDRELSDSQTECGRESRSLDGSRAELTGASGGASRSARSRDSHPPPAGWATPKRQRLESPGGLRGSDEMLRAAVRNSRDRAAERRHGMEKREEPTSSESTFRSHGPDESSGDASRFTETPESADASKPRKKRRQSVCIYIDSLESPSAEIKSETATATSESATATSESAATATSESATATSEAADGYTTPRTSGGAETGSSTFLTSEVSSTNACSETTSTGNVDSASTNDAQYRDSLDERTEESANENEILHLSSCVIKLDDNSVKGDSALSHNAKSERPLSKESESTVELLEIVVSETLNSSAFECNKGTPMLKNEANFQNTSKVLDFSNKPQAMKQQMDLDEYVSNILVESLNSLTDQIEEMNASMGGDRKISIVEKEIKVKLQNTGMNTIVHLSPTSNNPIIFGNAELYDKSEIEESKKTSCHEDESNMSADTIKIELTDNNDLRLTDSSDNVTHFSAKEIQNDNDPASMMMMSNENINKTVLQQIQKLFQDGLQQFNPKLDYPGRMVPEISHIEISNVDVFLDDNEDPNCESSDRIEINTDRTSGHYNCSLEDDLSITESVLGEVGTGTYYKQPTGPVLVPRFSAFPNTVSMEVNTSSSDEGDVMGSDCTSLVDSLDDPNSPRNILLVKTYSNRRSELVRSAIDVLDLLPETSQDNESRSHMEKSEAFFIRIRENECDCEKENVIVADHMPDTIKQRLYRRHRKRELRMEYAKRKKVRQIRREIENLRSPDNLKSKKEIEKDCEAILESLIDEVITKIAEQEHKYMRIKQKSNNLTSKKSDDSLSSTGNKKTRKNRITADLSNLESFKVTKNGEVRFSNDNNMEKDHKTKKKSSNHEHTNKSKDRNNIRGMHSLRPHSPATPDEYGPKRIYQKSEIHDGNKCVEILEILEYVEDSQSSPDTTNSDENQNSKSKKNRKSKIPVPIYEQIHRSSRIKNIQKPYINAHLVRSSPNLKIERLTNYKIDDFIADIILKDAIKDNANDADNSLKKTLKAQQAQTRRASVPQQDTHRSRSSLRFKQIFDIIPEEKSSLSVESSNEDINFNRRVSAPVLNGKYIEANNNESQDKLKTNGEVVISKASKLSKSTSTSPPLAEDLKSKTRNVTTSPLKNTVSAATSPIVLPKYLGNGTDIDKNKNSFKPAGNAKKSLSSHGTREGWLGFYKPNKLMMEDEGSHNSKEAQPSVGSIAPDDCKSTCTQYGNPQTQSTVRTIESEKNKQIIINHDKIKANNDRSHTIQTKGRLEDNRKLNSNRKREKNPFDKVKNKDLKNQRDLKMVHSQSDPQTRTDFYIKKTDTKKIQMIAVEKSEEDTLNPKSLKVRQADRSHDTSSDTDTDSAKSLLCSLAPKWLAMASGARQKRQVRKKPSQEQQPHQNAAGGWSVTVAGNCYTALPADVEMRLSFPKPPAPHATSQSDSGFGEDNRTRRPIAEQKPRETSCKCRHCDDCTCSRFRRQERDSSCSPFLPPTHNKKMTLTMKESSGSSILASKSLKQRIESLPELESYKASKNNSKRSVQSRRPSLNCWLPGSDPPARISQHPRATEALAVLGSAIIPESKPRVRTMSERDLTRVYTPRLYLRS